MTDLSRTALHAEHLALGARMVPFAGYSMPVQYEGVVKEHHAVRSAAGLFDVSHMGELLLSGEHAVAVVDYLVTNDIKGLEVGRALYTVCCNASGTILDDLIVYRLGLERVLVVCNASNRTKIRAHFARAADAHCDFADQSDATALLALQGPRALDILGKAGAGSDLTSLPTFGVGEGTVGGVTVTVARTGYTGEDGVELFCPVTDSVQIWRALLEAGAAAGIRPAGLGCRDTLRLEARLSLYGNEIDETTHPFEAGLGWVVKLDKGDFVGRDALVSVKESGYERRLVGFEMRGRGIARHGYPIVNDHGIEIGIVTSGSPSPTLGINIGLGYVPKALCRVGTRFGVSIRGKVVEAEVVKTPFFKRSN